MPTDPSRIDARIDAWFAARGWRPFDFQREVWAAMADGRSGLLHATTGSGKTLAVWMGALQRARAGAGRSLLHQALADHVMAGWPRHSGTY